jgi:hypothetical protein
VWHPGHEVILSVPARGTRARTDNPFMAPLRRILVLLAILSGIAGTAPLRAAPEAWNAQVLWASAGRAYVVLAESTAVEPGTVLTFEEGGTTIARGEVAVAYEGELVAVNVTSGSLEKARSLPAVRITAEPPSIRPLPLLRIGYPAPGRSNLLFTCDRVTPRPPLDSDLYRVDALSDRSFRFVRRPEVASEAPWPDTLLVRLFEIAADEEIALERGDLDVAVFWPGEPSPHIRSHTAWKGSPSGSFAGWSLAATLPASLDLGALVSSGAETRVLRSMNEDLFRGDLSACGSVPASAPPDSAAPRAATRARFEVSHAIPGWQPLERFLNQGLPSKPGSGTPLVRLQRTQALPQDAPAGGPAAPGQSDASQEACVFDIRCPILSAPRLRPYLSALGPDAMVRLFACSPGFGP